ncbi:lantibiotic dehydratase family protein [Niabella sp. W65]|nr:lantibiotic dehydratase family protein [Niabella sp. W65]MCH7362824.1 lantibiotic dehydratase family protein [Niabella sp. W65]
MLKINEKIILRTPRFPVDGSFKNHWHTLKQLISDASPDFYQVIKGMSYEDLLAADSKIHFSAQKYFNRSCYRCTPFGAFAAVSLATVCDKENPISVSEDLVIHAYPDWSESKNIDVANVYSLAGICLLQIVVTTLYRTKLDFFNAAKAIYNLLR